ncbi:MAG: nucleotidyltransferase domain-containing protein [Candidatus Methanomethylicia archaeon]
MPKIIKVNEYREVIYDEKQWTILSRKREIARYLMEILRSISVNVMVHGSIARGDVDEDSDIDIFIPSIISPFRLEILLEDREVTVYLRRIIQATPTMIPKVYYYLDPKELIAVSYPLAKLNRREIEFYRFSGVLDLSRLARSERVAGINKRLVFIEPTSYGHIEYSVIGCEAEAARKLGVSPSIIKERISILTRRSKIGRTGLFISYDVPHNEQIEEAIEKLAVKNKIFRKIISR